MACSPAVRSCTFSLIFIPCGAPDRTAAPTLLPCPSCRSRGVTFCGLVNMNGVLSRSQIVHVQFDLYPLRCSRQNSGANAFALSVLQLHSHRFWTFVALGVSRGQRKREHCGYKQQFSWKYSFESHVLTSFVTVLLPD